MHIGAIPLQSASYSVSSSARDTDAPARRDRAMPSASHQAGNPDKLQPDREAHNNPSSPEYKALQELKARDREVRQHEQAHMAAGGQYVSGGPTYSYQKGPDGRRYAVGGEVQIDTSAVRGDPEATLRKMETVQRAAMAPAEPSTQDRTVAAQAAQKASQARAEIQRANTESSGGPAPNSPSQAYQAAGASDPAGALIDLQA